MKSKQKNRTSTSPRESDALVKLNNVMVITLLIILAIVPLLLRVIVLQGASPALGETVLGSGQIGDIFTFYKLIWLVIGTILLAVLFGYRFYRQKFQLKLSYINVPTAFMYLFFLLSGLFAEYKMLSFLGQYNRHEGTLAYLCYLALFFIAAHLSYSAKQTKWLYYPMYLYIAVNAVLGLIWFYNVNILDYASVKALLVPTSLLATGGLGKGSFLANTISNPDFSSGIGAMFTTMFLTRAALAKDLRAKTTSLVFVALSFAMIVASVARSGLYTIFVMLPLVLVVILLSKERKQALLSFGAGILTMAVVLVILSLHNPALLERSKTLGFLDHVQPTAAKIQTERPAANAKTSMFSVVSLAQELNPLTPQPVYAETNQSGADDEFNLPAAGWAPGTGRLYIWQQTVKLIPKHPLLGYGMDTLPYYFPQNDPNKNSGLNSPDIIVDKPHDFYLDIAYGAGLPAFAAFLILILRHVYANLKLLKSRTTTENRTAIIVLFTAFIAFLIQGIFNDSTLGTAPFFWVIFGVNVALLRQESLAPSSVAPKKA